MNSHLLSFRQHTIDKISHFLDQCDNNTINQQHLHGVVYTAALASNPALAPVIVQDLQIPITSRVGQIAVKAIRFVSIDAPLSDSSDVLFVGDAKNNDITCFMICAFAASFVKNFESYEVLRKLFTEFDPGESIVDDVICLTSYVQTLTQLSLEASTPVHIKSDSADGC